MPPERTKQLVYELDAWYRSHTMRQKDLANELGLSAQQLAEILALRNRPTGEQALQIAEFLETENMSTTKTPHPTIRHDPDKPKSLDEARARIGALNEQLRELRSGTPTISSAATPVQTLPKPQAAPGSAVGTPSDIQAPARPRVNEPMQLPGTPLPKMRLSGSLDTPASIENALRSMNDEALRSALFGTCKNDVEKLQQRLILAELEHRRGE